MSQFDIEWWAATRDGYEVSTVGRVRSLDRVVISQRRVRTAAGRARSMPREFRQAWKGQLLSANRHIQGYPVVTLGGRGSVRVHRLMLETFVGPCPDGMEACHHDDDRRNNRLANLRWDTRRANQQDKLRNGRNPNAAQTHCKRGHEFTPENTYLSQGHRKCRTCTLSEEYKMRRRARDHRKRREH
jgi:hypothetical protein